MGRRIRRLWVLGGTPHCREVERDEEREVEVGPRRQRTNRHEEGEEVKEGSGEHPLDWEALEGHRVLEAELGRDGAGSSRH